MASTEKITKYNLADLKNTSDDALPNYLNSLKFKQIHTLADTRLALGYSAFAIAAACFLWDYKLGFDNTKWITAGAVALYTVLNTALTVWVTYVEKGTVYQGVAPSGETISIATSTKKNVPIYNVKVTVKPKSGAETKIELKRPFTEWFDVQGAFVPLPFQTMFATSVTAIGKADPKRAAAPLPDLYSADSHVLDAILAASGTTTGTDSGSAKQSKRRKA